MVRTSRQATKTIQPLSFEERDARSKEATKAWRKALERRASPERFELRDGRNKPVFTGTSFECSQLAKSMWTRFLKVHDRGLGRQLPRALVRIDNWGDEFAIEFYPTGIEVSWSIQEGARAA